MNVATQVMAGAPELPGVLGSLTPLLDHYGYLAIAGMITLEDFGVPVPGAAGGDIDDAANARVPARLEQRDRSEHVDGGVESRVERIDVEDRDRLPA